MDIAVLLAQITATTLIAGWLSLGARDNILFPALNEVYTAEAMAMTRLRDTYPDVYSTLAHRAVTSRRLHRLAFRLVVAAEVLVCVLLWLGVAGLLMVIVGAALPDTGRTLALIGATGFTAIWAGFLILGNHFCYWFCHEGAQNTHYMMTLWGLGTMILLMQG